LILPVALILGLVENSGSSDCDRGLDGGLWCFRNSVLAKPQKLYNGMKYLCKAQEKTSHFYQSVQFG